MEHLTDKDLRFHTVAQALMAFLNGICALVLGVAVSGCLPWLFVAIAVVFTALSEFTEAVLHERKNRDHH